ncbi:FtsQ-type POTRA domain-containing protein [Humibacter sp. RRB41]|uniref:FtsQ-type POTRA domain-containing protein n=1 Tax=Humibacter sp. RRB41 TaxID=2919946 RepID=UPI001FA9432E|nr:FtsQ-type POTRA domain-containing protein [Humibacter sp. RRB41]
MKRPQGFENSASRLTARTEKRAPATEPAAGRGRARTSGAPDAAAERTRVTSSSSAGVTSTGVLDGSSREPEATTEPIRVIVPPPRESARDRIRAALAEKPASVTRPATTPAAVEDDSPSVRAAARRRRRYERAEVKRFTRGARRRRLAWLIGAGSVVLVLAGAALVSISPAMALRTIDVVGSQRVSATDVRHALGPQLGTPLPLLDNGEIKTELAKFPLIRSYSIQAEPPGTLVVHIVERTPIALLQVPSGYQLVDQAGVIIETTADRPAGFPVIALPGDASTTSRNKEFAASAAVLAALPAGMLSKVGTVSATGAQDVTLKLTSGVTVVWGGPDQPDLKSWVLSDLLKAAPGASVYDVSAPNSPVTR